MLNIITVLTPIILGLVLLSVNCNTKFQRTYVMMVVSITTVLTLYNNINFIDSEITFLTIGMGWNLALKTDILAVFFTSIIAVIWTVVTVYTFKYMSHLKEEKRFYSFLLTTFGCLLGVCYSSNPITLYMFFELMSLSAYMLVIHERTHDSMLAGRKFLYYSLFGTAMGLMGIMYLYYLIPAPTFVAGGILPLYGFVGNGEIFAITLLSVIGFGCKAGMYPLHSWLAVAHPVAPAPASSLLSGLITKAGVIAIIRILYYVIGPSLLIGTTLQTVLISLSLLTIFMGSMLALRAKVLKKRLAYSSVSQVSYVLLGLFLFNQLGFVGALLQVLFHALAKNLLFLSVGAIIYKLGFTTAQDIKGLGNNFPCVFIPFTIGGLSLVGIPLTGGFVSKWYLAQGALTLPSTPLALTAVAIVIISALLTGFYLLWVSASAFFDKPIHNIQSNTMPKSMIIPLFVLSALIITLGIFPTVIIDFITTISTTLGLGGAI